MKKTLQIKLLDSATGTGPGEIVGEITSRIISWLHVLSFSNQIRFGKPMKATDNEIHKIERARARAEQLLDNAKRKNKTARVICNLIIEVEP